jgi:His-Xaa-Ser system protein HxsD
MSWPGIENDVLGELGTVAVDPTLYSEQAVFRAAYWLTDRQFVFLDREGGRIRVEIRNKPGSEADLRQACAEFCNALVDFRLRDIVAQETGSIREALVKQAFMEGVPTAGLSGARSNEKHLTKAGS